MKTEKKLSGNNKFEPYYSDILKLSKKKNISLAEARRELINKEAKKNKIKLISPLWI